MGATDRPDGEGEAMNGAGLFLAVIGVWVLAQVLAGDALNRLELFQ
jgi:hypothetical protein